MMNGIERLLDCLSNAVRLENNIITQRISEVIKLDVSTTEKIYFRVVPDILFEDVEPNRYRVDVKINENEYLTTLVSDNYSDIMGTSITLLNFINSCLIAMEE